MVVPCKGPAGHMLLVRYRRALDCCCIWTSLRSINTNDEGTSFWIEIEAAIERRGARSITKLTITSHLPTVSNFGKKAVLIHTEAG